MSQGGIANAADVNQLVTQANFQAAPPLFIAVQTTTTTSINSSAWTSITFSDVAGIIADTYSGHSTGTNPTRYVAQYPGYYTICGVVCFANTNTTQTRGARIALNGSPIQGAAQLMAATGTDTTPVTPSRDVFLNGTTDYIELQGWQNSGVGLATAIAGDVASALSLRWSHS